MPSVVVAAAVTLAVVARALDPAPVALQASDWLGIDGNWSTVSFLLGSTAEVVNVFVSTTLSEFWAVGQGGCLEKEPHCTAARGGIYNPFKSKNWSPIGLWRLGLQYLRYNANGQYGFDTINAYSPITDIGFSMSNVLISAINTTSPFLGFFGLGIQQGRFKGIVADSPMTQAVKTFGWIPSYSYGYTAGAHYRNTVVSATLGGYDTSRFVPHDTTFTLTQGESIPRTLVRSIQMEANNGSDKFIDWNTRIEPLSDWDTSFTAMIDSSTPYLWLPEAVCDRFAQMFNMSYNKTLDLYTLSDEQYRDYRNDDSFLFVFSLTSFDNHDSFGQPLQVPGLVNITLPLRALVGLLTYPFDGETIKYGDPAVPYFMLRRSHGSSSFVIGRAFLQESYIITKFDEALFSIHQARFPAKPEADAKLVAIKQSSNSPYPQPPQPKPNDGLTTGQMAGIAVGVVLLCAVVMIGCCCYCRRRRSRRVKGAGKVDDNKEIASTLDPDSPKAPVWRILSKIARRKQSSQTIPDAANASQVPSEAPDCQIFELPAPVPPVELDAGSDDNSLVGEAELGTENIHNLSAYELARRRLDRQRQGPVPEYTPLANDAMLPPEKAISHLRPSDEQSPVSLIRPRGTESNSNSLRASELSPVSPRSEWHTQSTALPSPVTVSVPSHSTFSGTGSRSEQSDSSTSPGFTSDDPLPPPPTISVQRAPISPSKIFCLGRLPQNLEINRQSVSPRVACRERSTSIQIFNTNSLPSEGSLGSNYTEEEERIVEELTQQSSPSQATLGQSTRGGQEIGPSSPRRVVDLAQKRGIPTSQTASEPGRINPANDLVHVPQMADKRYSWEDER